MIILEMVNVKYVGAVGDGTTNDLNSFKIAFAQATTMSNPYVYIPASEYNISRTQLTDTVHLSSPLSPILIVVT